MNKQDEEVHSFHLYIKKSTYTNLRILAAKLGYRSTSALVNYLAEREVDKYKSKGFI